jgi:hypothetical protein
MFKIPSQMNKNCSEPTGYINRQGHHFTINGTWGKCSLCGHLAQTSVLDLTPQCPNSDLYCRRLENTSGYERIGKISIDDFGMPHYVKNGRVVLRVQDWRSKDAKDPVDAFNAQIRRKVREIVDEMIRECKIDPIDEVVREPVVSNGWCFVTHVDARSYAE